MTIVDNMNARVLADECLQLVLDLTKESKVSPEVVRQAFLLLHQQLGDMGNIELAKADSTPTKRRPARLFTENTRLSDEYPMPFGKWKGTRLGEVPDHYWRWFLNQDWCDEWPDLVEYANIVVDE